MWCRCLTELCAQLRGIPVCGCQNTCPCKARFYPSLVYAGYSRSPVCGWKKRFPCSARFFPSLVYAGNSRNPRVWLAKSGPVLGPIFSDLGRAGYCLLFCAQLRQVSAPLPSYLFYYPFYYPLLPLLSPLLSRVLLKKGSLLHIYNISLLPNSCMFRCVVSSI